MPNTIVLTGALSNAYNLNANSSVQIITFRNMGTNFTTTASIGALAWDGTIGGIVAIRAPGVLTLAHTISADYAGFRGGLANSTPTSGACVPSVYTTSVSSQAAKGEGIYRRISANYTWGRGKLINGGGGGNNHNSGGAGGGNYTAGGVGGTGYTGAATGCSPSAGGIAGISLSTHIAPGRVFMGGGGGGGHQNENVGSPGGSGGGIVFIKTGTLQTTVCGGVRISADGAMSAIAGTDGAGGAGAGGSIVFSVGTFSISSACQLTVSANGGEGGDSFAAFTVPCGGGGGGGQGVILYSGPQPTSNVNSYTFPGAGGLSCGSCTGSVNGGTGAGVAHSGVLSNFSSPLPVELLNFSAMLNDNGQVDLVWNTAVEKNAGKFIIERMNNEGELTHPGVVEAKGSYSRYSFVDPAPWVGTNYYRLNQIDEDGTSHRSFWVDVNSDPQGLRITLAPNPLNVGQKLKFMGPLAIAGLLVEVINVDGKCLHTGFLQNEGRDFYLATDDLTPGAYIVRVSNRNFLSYHKLVVSE